MLRRITPSWAATALMFACTAHADDGATVIVTATRFAEIDPLTPANVSVITREDITHASATNVPDLLKASAGIEVRPLYGSMGIDATIDLRGFGDTAGSNTLLLLNGQRLNPIDGGSISWSTIPLASIQRIEIIRGAGTVLYGDRASGGVINIVTDASHTRAATVDATIGSYGYRGADAGIAGGAGATHFDLTGHYVDTNGWRRNSQADQQAASGRVGRDVAGGEIFSDFSAYKDSNGLPGSILTSDYGIDPRRARTPFDNQHRDGYRLRPGITLKLSGSVTFDAEIAIEHENYESDNVSFASIFERKRTMVSGTPRLRWVQTVGASRNETVIGLDYYEGKVDATSIGMPSLIPQLARQASAAWYVQDVIVWSDRWSTTVAGRQQQVRQHAEQGPYLASAGAGTTTVPGFDGSATRTRSAFDFGLVYSGRGWRGFGKYGSIFRFANTDELYGYNPFTGNPVFSGDLLPQHGTVGELGASFDAGGAVARLSAYRMDLSDEIDFDGVSFANVNLPATRRQGVDAEIDSPAIAGVKAHAAYTYIDARFRQGINAGNEIPLVARNKASGRLTSYNGEIGTYSLTATYVSHRPYSGDFASQRGSLAGYLTVDLQGRWTLGRWALIAKLVNAFDRRYAPFAGYSTFVNDYYYFPADGRSAFLSARYDFH